MRIQQFKFNSVKVGIKIISVGGTFINYKIGPFRSGEESFHSEPKIGY